MAGPEKKLADGDTTQTHQFGPRTKKATKMKKEKVMSRECHVPRTWPWGPA